MLKRDRASKFFFEFESSTPDVILVDDAYIALAGQAFFLLQKRKKERNREMLITNLS